MNEMSRSEEKNYKLVDLIKFICAFLVIGIHTRQFLSVSDIADRLFYYDVSNYSVPFFYACSGYFLLAKKSNIKLGDRLKIRIKKVLRLYLVSTHHPTPHHPHPEERIWAGRQPWVPDAPKIKHDKMKQFYMIDMERKM